MAVMKAGKVVVEMAAQMVVMMVSYMAVLKGVKTVQLTVAWKAAIKAGTTVL